MSISDRLDQLEREAVEANEHLLLDALRAVLDLCGLIEKAHEANPERTYEQGMEVAAHKMRTVIAATLGEKA